MMLGAGLIASLPACFQGSPSSLHILTVDPIRPTFDPWSVKYAGDYLIGSSISTPFVELDQNERWSFPFCESWKRLDRQNKVICELAKDLRWSDGSPLLPEEILESLKESIRKSDSSGVALLVKQVQLDAPRQLTIEFNQSDSNSLWALTGPDQSILDPESRDRLRKTGSLDITLGIKRGSGRFRLKSVQRGTVVLEPNPYFPIKASKATISVEIEGNLSIPNIENRLANKMPGQLTQVLGGTLSASDLSRLRGLGLQEFDQPIPNATAAFYFGAHAKLTREERRFLFSAVALKMLQAKAKIGIPSIGFAPPSMLGSLDQDSWRSLLAQSSAQPKKPIKIDLFVMQAFKDTDLYVTAKSTLASLPVQLTETVYDPDKPDSAEWKRRMDNDYDLLYGYDESYSPDPDPFWRELRVFTPTPKTFFTEAELDQALLETDTKKRSVLYQQFEHKCAQDPFMIPLRRFGNKLFVAPGVDVEPQEAFGMMINPWAFKVSK